MYKSEELREISFETNYLSNAKSSCLIKMGKTWVLCTATIENKVPLFLKNSGTGWITAEYGMIPTSTDVRTQRESIRGKQSGRTQEIQRIIGRSLRASIDLEQLGEKQIIIDCDVIQADGGTRVASINGGYIALCLAIKKLEKSNIRYKKSIIKRHISAVSCGIIKEKPTLDLEFCEDKIASVDANFVLDSDDNLIEVQCTAENGVCSFEQMVTMLDLAKKGCKYIRQKQLEAIENS